MQMDQYVNRIVKKVNCSETKRKEIAKQLESDISGRMQQGEELAQIMESMGTPEEIAEAFNQNLSKEEQKAYKRNKMWKNVASAVALLAVLIACVWWMMPKTYEVGKSGKFTQAMLEERAKEVILLLEENDFEALQAEASEQMKPMLTQETIDEARAAVSADWGGLKEIGTIYAAELKMRGKVYGVTQVHVDYENVNVLYTINFNSDMELEGLFWQ